MVRKTVVPAGYRLERASILGFPTVRGKVVNQRALRIPISWDCGANGGATNVDCFIFTWLPAKEAANHLLVNVIAPRRFFSSSGAPWNLGGLLGRFCRAAWPPDPVPYGPKNLETKPWISAPSSLPSPFWSSMQTS